MNLDPTFFSEFLTMDDPRINRTRRHRFEDIIIIAILAVIAGADGWEEMETFGEVHEAWLRTWLPLPNGIPSHDTFARVISRLDPVALDARYGAWLARIARDVDFGPQPHIAIDGKRLGGSTDDGLERSALTVVSAWASTAGVMLGQVATEDAEGELTVLRQLLRVLELRDCLVTIDAGGCHTDVVATLVAQGATYLLPVKDNQRTLADAVGAVVAQHPQPMADMLAGHETMERGHGRWERRTVQIITDVASVTALEPWASVQAIIVVERERRTPTQHTIVTQAFISNGMPTAEAAARAIRAHWSIENQLHWVLDVVFKEDACRITDAWGAANVALLRRLALGLLKREPTMKASMARKRFRAGMDREYLMDVVRFGI